MARVSRLGQPAKSRSRLSAIAAPFIGTTRALSFFKILHFPPSPTGRKRVRFQRKAIFYRQRRVAAPENFGPKFSVFHFTTPENPFVDWPQLGSAGRLS